MIEYKVLSADRNDQLEEQLNRWTKEGWWMQSYTADGHGYTAIMLIDRTDHGGLLIHQIERMQAVAAQRGQSTKDWMEGKLREEEQALQNHVEAEE